MPTHAPTHAQLDAPHASAVLAANYFDGISARAQRVQLRLQAGVMHVDGDGVALRLPLDQVQWPERTRHGARVAHFRKIGRASCRERVFKDV